MRTRTTRCLTGRLTGLTAALMLTSTLSAVAQTPYIPYFGKNQIRYDNFRWHIYTTDHFQIYYYPEIEQHLERVAGYAESAYQQVSADLKHDLAFKIPLILFKTSSEFQQQNVIPGAAQEGVGAFAEPFRDRMVLPIDEPPDLLYRLVVHELTHIFEFDIIPQSLIRRSVPLWGNIDGPLASRISSRPAVLDRAKQAEHMTAPFPEMSHLKKHLPARPLHICRM